MKSSFTVTLFAEYTDPSRRPATLLASALIHTAVTGVISFAVLYVPPIVYQVNERYVVRHLDLETPEQQMHRAAVKQDDDAALRMMGRALATRGASTAHPALPEQRVRATPSRQTLMQPDLAAQLASAENIPIPEILIWTPGEKIVRTIVAPHTAKPAAAPVPPSLQAPNQEINLTDVQIAAAPLPDETLHILAGTTTPVTAPSAELTPTTPETISQTDAQPTPAAVMSLSDLRMKKGTVTLPPVQESTTGSPAGALAGSKAQPASTAATSSSSLQTGVPQGADPSPSAASAIQPANAPSVADASSGISQQEGASNSVTEIKWPKNGSFGAVVVGDSINDQFPEAAAVWKGRVAYTVYLHVGLTRSWILQYSLPPGADATADGAVAGLEAPWPYEIVRPNLAPDSVNADALMVHGFVDRTGRFETLSVVFPQEFPQAQFVLKCLEQWQFRPASQNGQMARVEVLLIVPEELE
jgi:hypothetical protein